MSITTLLHQLTITLMILLLFIFILLIFNYYVHNGKYGKFINLIRGPQGYPILGNILKFQCSREESWKVLFTLNEEYYPIFKIWIFFLPIIFIRHPNDLETILSNNTKHIEKSFTYNVLRPWLGNGIFTSGGTKWRSRRKMLTAAFHFNILQQFVTILIKEGENMTRSLKETGSSVVKDLMPFVSEYTLNAICETAMGNSIEDLNEFQQQYRKAIYQISEIIIYRLMRPWLYSDWIFSWTRKGKQQAKLLKILHGFPEHILKKRKLYHESTDYRFLKNFGSDTSTDAKMIENKKQLALVDLLIAASRKGLLTDTEVKEEIDAFMFGGHDTTAKALTYLLLLLAEHKDIQNRVRHEINIVMEKNGGKITMNTLQNLLYLDNCIKEALRLYPSAYVISRITGEDVKLQSYSVPARTTVFLNIYAVQRDPNFWPNPEVFDPDRFLPERIRNRHPYSYIPFSAGPRNCLGQRYALLEMKAMITPVIHNFYLESVDCLKDLRINIDLKPPHILRIKFIPIK